MQIHFHQHHLQFHEREVTTFVNIVNVKTDSNVVGVVFQLGVDIQIFRVFSVVNLSEVPGLVL